MLEHSDGIHQIVARADEYGGYWYYRLVSEGIQGGEIYLGVGSQDETVQDLNRVLACDHGIEVAKFEILYEDQAIIAYTICDHH